MEAMVCALAHLRGFSWANTALKLPFSRLNQNKMVSPTDQEWLKKCQPESLPVLPFDRYIYMLEHHVVKKALQPGELGYDGYQPEISTIAQRDENELHTLELVRQYTDIPVPKLIYQASGQAAVIPKCACLYTAMVANQPRFNIFERIPGITIFEGPVWDTINPRQQEGLKLQVQGYIRQLAKIPNDMGGVRSLSTSGEIIHTQLPFRGPFKSTADFLHTYKDVDAPLIHQISPFSSPVLSHMDWDLSNIVLHPDLDGVAGVIYWERAAFFPEGGGSVHRMCHQWRGWETLFDGIQFE